MTHAQIISRSLSLLPPEIIELILSEIDQVPDLLSLAYTSRDNANIVIPNHTEYRKIRTRTPMPAMWFHLAQRADLSRNIREVQLCTRQDYTAPDRYPVSLVDSSLKEENEEERINNICTALRHMKRLTTFVWQYEADIKAGLRTLDHRHEDMILTSLSQAPNLRHLMLRGQCGAHVRDGKGTRRRSYPLWTINNLESLCLLGAVWANKSNSAHIIRFIQRSPNIKHLEVPMELDGLGTCHLPCLRRVGLPLTLGAIATSLHGAITNSVIRFLQCNSNIEVLNWNTVASYLLPPDALPNLRCLSSNSGIVAGLEMSESTRRPIECLDLWDADADRLTELQNFDSSTLRKLKIANVRSLESLHIIAQKFAGITWLWLPGKYMQNCSNRWILVEYELPQLLDILSSFRNLEVFRGPALWEAVGGDSKKEQMHIAIIDLIERCPRLRQLDHCSSYEKRKAVKLIKIHRKKGMNGELERVWYEVQRPPPGNVFDTIMRTFD
ncbi:hypothetical protein H2248_010342 [Termitomyces sp. 'cryptogamus']|nr:hypothetical protein H2248_010342 [Termitomyces sp. 'cryptogamus']